MCYMAARAGLVGIRELRQNLSVYVERVKKGHTLTVTEHGRAVAELRPLPRDDEPLARLIAQGRVTRAGRSLTALPRPLSLALDRPASTLLDELRGD